jgi:hypothetical protein
MIDRVVGNKPPSGEHPSLMWLMKITGLSAMYTPIRAL